MGQDPLSHGPHRQTNPVRQQVSRAQQDGTICIHSATALSALIIGSQDVAVHCTLPFSR